jgi:hypothetical protein
VSILPAEARATMIVAAGRNDQEFEFELSAVLVMMIFEALNDCLSQVPPWIGQDFLGVRLR